MHSMRKLENLFPMFMSSSSFKTKKATSMASQRSQSHHTVTTQTQRSVTQKRQSKTHTNGNGGLSRWLRHYLEVLNFESGHVAQQNTLATSPPPRLFITFWVMSLNTPLCTHWNHFACLLWLYVSYFTSEFPKETIGFACVSIGHKSILHLNSYRRFFYVYKKYSHLFSIIYANPCQVTFASKDQLSLSIKTCYKFPM